MAETPHKPLTRTEEQLRRYFSPQRVAKIRSATRFMGHLLGVKALGQNFNSADFRGANLKGAYFEGASLIDADLGGADLRGADFREANLDGAHLDGADLTGARLGGANLRRTDLTAAILVDADLRDAHLIGAILVGAKLVNAHLFGTNFGGANLAEAAVDGAHLSLTSLVDVDLFPFCNAVPPIRHVGPTTVDYRSVLRSLRAPRLKEFLVHTGMPEIFAEYTIDCAMSVKGSVFKLLRSTYISYGQPDVAFAKKLNDALSRNGVATFFFKEHALPGKKLHRLIRTGVNAYDRVILVCSKASLTRPGVLNEIEETLAREANDAGDECLIPLRLDDHVFSDDFTDECKKLGKEDFLPALRRRIIGDFREAEKDDGKFTSELLKVIAVLKK
jgi:hypothetical protein